MLVETKIKEKIDPMSHYVREISEKLLTSEKNVKELTY